MSDEVGERMSRLPGRLPTVGWAPASQLRRIGRYRRRRRTATVALALLLAVVAGTGVGYRVLTSTAAPIQPSTSDIPTVATPTTTSTVGPSAPVPPSVMLVAADLPAGYQVYDQIVATVTAGRNNRSFTPTCGAYANLTIESVTGARPFRYHSYYVGSDPSTPRIDETVARFGSADAVIAARTQIFQLVPLCQHPAPSAGAVFSFDMPGTDPAGGPTTEHWTVVSAPEARLMAIVRTPSTMDRIGPAALARLGS